MQTEYIWIITGSPFDDLLNTKNNQQLESPNFTRCGAKWSLQFIRKYHNHAADDELERYKNRNRPANQFNVKLICKTLNSTANISVNYSLEFVEINESYDSAASFNKDRLNGNPVHVFQQNRYKNSLYNLQRLHRENGITQLSIKCSIQETMIQRDEQKNNEFVWKIDGKFWQRFKTKDENLVERRMMIPTFQTNNGAEWDIYCTINEHNGTIQPYLSMKQNKNIGVIGVECNFQAQETGDSMGLLGIGDGINFRTGYSYKLKRTFDLSKLKPFKQLTIKINFKFLQTSKIIWKVDGALMNKFKTANYEHPICSSYFMANDGIWYFKIFPNGRSAPKNYFGFAANNNRKMETSIPWKQGNCIIYLYCAAKMGQEKSWYHLSSGAPLNYECGQFEANFKTEQIAPGYCGNSHVLFAKTFKYELLQKLENISFKCNVYPMPMMRERRFNLQNKSEDKICLSGMIWSVKSNINERQIVFQLVQYALKVSSVIAVRINQFRNRRENDQYERIIECDCDKLNKPIIIKLNDQESKTDDNDSISVNMQIISLSLDVNEEEQKQSIKEKNKDEFEISAMKTRINDLQKQLHDKDMMLNKLQEELNRKKIQNNDCKKCKEKDRKKEFTELEI
eukprot:319125_1